jgi:hypothetical protein
MLTKFRLESRQGRDHSQVLGVDARTILKLILGKQDVRGIVWINLVQDRGQRRAFVNTVTTF